MDPWAYHPHPEVWALLGGIAAVYIVAVRRRPAGAAVTARHIVLFVLGLAALWLAADWPVHDLSESYLFSAHMAQHTALTLVAPPLLLAGAPGWLIERLLSPRWLAGAVRQLARPLVAGLLFNVMVVVSHI
ncbi:MAG: cytochrome c oxidase assembly protein, partial [Acidimicrobiales bacterium]